MKMAPKLKFIKMKRPFIFLFLTSLLLSGCSNAPLERRVFCFDSMMNIKLFEGEETDLDNIEKIFSRFGKLSDNYQARDIINVYSINQTNEEVEIDKDLYNLLETSFNVPSLGANHFNPLCGSLAKRWKESLSKNEVLSNSIIESELSKINSSSISFKDGNIVQRNGEAEIDLGAIAKGYCLDKIKDYLNSKDFKKYLINAGYSSILLGEKNVDDGYFKVGINNLNGAYLKLKNCFISTSGTEEQSTTIDGITYSHIINPSNGSAVSNYDNVIVISDSGYLCDALSTSLMMADLNEIKEVEEQCFVQVIAIKDKQIIYKNSSLEVYK